VGDEAWDGRMYSSIDIGQEYRGFVYSLLAGFSRTVDAFMMDDDDDDDDDDGGCVALQSTALTKMERIGNTLSRMKFSMRTVYDDPPVLTKKTTR